MFIGIGIAVFVIASIPLLWVGIDGFRTLAPRWSDIVLIALGACAIVNAVVLIFVAVRVSMWRRRSPKAETEAERWDAFRRYLTDFPRLQEAPPATLELWERYLVYGITFGIAERVLQGAQLHMPEELHQASTIYWISPTGDLGFGRDRASGSATCPPASAPRSRLPRRAAPAAASPAVEAEAAAGAAEGPGS